MNCVNNVPWLFGQPSDICWLDDEEQLRQFGIALRKDMRRSDYYIHWNGSRFSLIERKDGPSRIDTAIEQFKHTIVQLRAQGKIIERIIVISEKLSPNEKSTYGREHKHRNFLFLKRSAKRDRLNIAGIDCEFFTIDEVDELRHRGRLPWL